MFVKWVRNSEYVPSQKAPEEQRECEDSGRRLREVQVQERACEGLRAVQ